MRVEVAVLGSSTHKRTNERERKRERRGGGGGTSDTCASCTYVKIF